MKLSSVTVHDLLLCFEKKYTATGADSLLLSANYISEAFISKTRVNLDKSTEINQLKCVTH